MKNWFKIALLLWTSFSIPGFAQQTFKLHSHNDYEQEVPFWGAFGAGAASIEVDVILQNGQLMAAHEVQSILPKRTLKSLYLEPIQKAKDLGMIDFFGFHLLVDIKTEAYTTLDQIVKDAFEFENLLFSSKNLGGLKLIISGNRPKVSDYENYPEWVFFDYQSTQLTQDLPWKKIGMVSLSFRQFSVWNGKGRIVEAEKKKLQDFIDLVHSFQKPVRFWASPDGKTAWKSFLDMGVDFINTDQPALARTYLSTLAQNLVVPHSQHAIYTPSFVTDGKNLSIQKIILMIGDGNGLAQLSSGLFANGGQLNLSQLRQIGLILTQAADDFTTDSAAGATAFATGQKANNRALGLNPAGDSLASLPEILSLNGFKSGIVTTDRLTGATPAAFYAHHPERDDVDLIAAYLPKSKLDLFIGAGKDDFTRFGIDRLAQLQKAGFTLVHELKETPDAKRLGYFAADGGMHSVENGRGNYLSETANFAVEFLGKGNSPFFLMIESGMIDSGGHANHASMIVTEMHDFDLAIGEMIRYVDTHPETLLLVTADHETGGVSIPQGNLSSNEVELAFYSDDHTGIMVPLFAYGAQSHNFGGVYPNTEVFNKIIKILEKSEMLKNN
jgi:alkaline phosphatase